METWFRHGLKPLYESAPLFESKDALETKRGTTYALTDHDLVWQSGRVDSVLRKAIVGDLSFLILRYGAGVHIRPGELGDFMLFQVPLAGSAEIRVRDAHISSTPRFGAIISPTTPFELNWSEGCEQLLLKVPRFRIERACATLLGAEPDKPVEFSPQLVMDSALGRAWQHQIGALFSCLGEGGVAMRTEWWRAQEEALIQHLLLFQPNNYTDKLARPLNTQRRIRAAEQFIQNNLHNSVELADIARASGCSVRSLTSAFQEHYGQSPMAHLRQVRLQGAYAELKKAPPGSRVTDVALRWGFSHLGRFCSLYRKTYGETPLETLLR